MSRIIILTLIALCVTSMASYALPPTPQTSTIAPPKDPTALIGNELARIDTLIQATQHSLDNQKKLRERIVEYQKIQDLYLLYPDDNEILFRMVKSAYRTLEAIREYNLTQTFDPDFISELTILAQVATKRGIPKP